MGTDGLAVLYSFAFSLTGRRLVSRAYNSKEILLLILCYVLDRHDPRAVVRSTFKMTSGGTKSLVLVVPQSGVRDTRGRYHSVYTLRAG